MCLGVSAVSYLNRVSTKVTPARRNLTPFRAAVGKKHCVCLVALLYVQCVHDALLNCCWSKPL
jgi:hypothetical protein